MFSEISAKLSISESARNLELLILGQTSHKGWVKHPPSWSAPLDHISSYSARRFDNQLPWQENNFCRCTQGNEDKFQSCFSESCPTKTSFASHFSNIPFLVESEVRDPPKTTLAYRPALTGLSAHNSHLIRSHSTWFKYPLVTSGNF